MAKQIDFKEYTRIRDIVVKRNKRAAAAGLAPLVHFPTVKEIRAGYVPAKEALQAVKGFIQMVLQLRLSGRPALLRCLSHFLRCLSLQS